MTWIDLGVLREESENTFQLLEVVHDGTAGTRTVASKPGKSLSTALSETVIHVKLQLARKKRHLPSTPRNNRSSR
jgi:hypothetical protein